VVGTPRYISPEGAAGEHVDHRADLYAAALVLYTMLAGRGPFDHVQASELLSAKELEDPKPPSHFASDTVPPELDAVLLKALLRSPNERFQSAAEFRAALEGVERARTSSERPYEEDDVVTRTADFRDRPEPVEPGPALSPAAGRLAAAAVFLLVTMVTFAVGVGLVKLARTYL
jgi:serine/threonine-protein kinase